MEKKENISVLEAIKFLASHCDGAIAQDNIGFTKADADCYKRDNIFQFEQLLPSQEKEWFERLQKYSNSQLTQFNLTSPIKKSLKEVKKIQANQYQIKKTFATFKKVEILKEEKRVNIQFTYNRYIILGIKELKHRLFKWEDKVWEIKILNNTLKNELITFLKEYQFDPKEIQQLENTKFNFTEKDNKKSNSIGELIQDPLNKNKLIITFAFNKQILDSVKKISGRKWNQEKKQWEITLSSNKTIWNVRDFLMMWGKDFYINEPFKITLKQLFEKVKKEEFEKKDNLVNSKATDAIEINSEEFNFPLFPFQKAGIKYAITNKRSFIGDDMGLGKTIQAIATMVKTNTFPLLIICPNSLKLNWRDEWNKWLKIPKELSIINSEDSEEKILEKLSKDVIISNYNTVHKYLEIISKHSWKGLICDESHFLKENKTNRTKSVKKIVKKSNPERILFLTGTAIVNKPKELIPQIEILGHLETEFEGFWKFIWRYCNPKKLPWGLDISGSSNLKELNERLRKVGYIRREKNDVLIELPEKIRSYVSIPITNTSIYKKAEQDVIKFFKTSYEATEEEIIEYYQNKLKNYPKEKEKDIKNWEILSKEEKQVEKGKYLNQKIQNALSAEALVKINLLKKLSGEGKMKGMIEWISDFLQNGDKKLVVFAHHKALINKMAEHFKCNKITGEVSIEKRHEFVKDFQENKKTRLLFLNIAAGNVGLTLTAASNLVFLEQGWTPGEMDQAEDRIYRIGQEDSSVMIHYLLGENTIDLDIFKLIQEKRKITQQVNIGEVKENNKNQGSPSILNNLINVLTNKK
ncbi:MAG: DEAD/DEAH box helicase [Nanoarchaeota archaeon]|nr:DEAD/DEAH box helicase [Nanoarchaeota archaeon]